MSAHWKQILVASLVLGLGAVAEGRAGWADRLFAERAHDFGPVVRGATVRHGFVLTNRLNEPITIVGMRPSCGCTSGRANVSVVPPGGQATIEAAMDTTNFVGRKVTTLFVSLATPSGRQEEIGLGVSSTILSDVVLNPGTIDFGTVAKGQVAARTLTLDRVGSPHWRVERMVSASKLIDAQIDETARGPQLVQYRLTVRLKPTAGAGHFRDEIRIQTNDPEAQSIPVLITGQIQGELTASPALLALGRTPAAGSVQGRYLIRASKPFKIVAIEGQGDGFRIDEIEPGSKPLHVLNLTYKATPTGIRGDLRPTFRVTTDLAGEAPIDLAAMLHVDP